jgi:ferredoxin-NADP reductase/ferredoxin
MMTTAARPGIGGFRELRVVDKVRESDIITSFHLEPLEPEGWRPFRPGQFLVFRLPGAADGQLIVRNYSLSGPPDVRGRYRITVKREPAAAPDLPAGAGSGYLHDRIAVGQVLLAEGPRGDFVLDRDSRRPVVLLSGGVGLTPMVAMLHDLAAVDDRRVFFVHACENGDVHALRDEVEALVASRPGMSFHFIYRAPTERDRAHARFHAEGLVSKALLQSLLPLDDYDIYLCGPPAFMKATYRLMRELGVPASRIAYEFFGPATVLEPDFSASPTAPVLTPTPKPALAIADAIRPVMGLPTVEFRRSEIMATWNEGAGSLLALAEDHGLRPDFSCRAGICGTCSSRLLAGEVDYFEEPLDEVEDGQVLLCCSRPHGSIVLDL